MKNQMILLSPIKNGTFTTAHANIEINEANIPVAMYLLILFSFRNFKSIFKVLQQRPSESFQIRFC